MSLKYRVNRINRICKHWKLKKIHKFMAVHEIDKTIFKNFKTNIKLYLCKALDIPFEADDKKFIQILNKAKNNRTNVTPNGAVVPKRDYTLEYNIILRDWCNIIREMIKKKEKLISRFRITPNIRIKYGKELKDNIGRGLSTSLPHSDAWVEGPWGMNCFFPIFGDYKKNNLVYYEPKKFDDKLLKISKSYKEMQWVMSNYKKIDKILPEPGKIYISDYALVHNTFRKKNSNTRVSIDTTLFIGKHIPHADRIKEYRKNIPYFGVKELINPIFYAKDNYKEKKTVFSHYTTGNLKLIKLR